MFAYAVMSPADLTRIDAVVLVIFFSSIPFPIPLLAAAKSLKLPFILLMVPDVARRCSSGRRLQVTVDVRER
jgi:hypothetical protein